MLTKDETAISRMEFEALCEEVAALRKEVLALTEAKREADEADKHMAETFAAMQPVQGATVL